MHTVQSVMRQLEPAGMSGTVLAVFGVSRPAIEGMERRWPSSGRGIDLIDINRLFPGNENAPDAPSRHAGWCSIGCSARISITASTSVPPPRERT